MLIFFFNTFILYKYAFYSIDLSDSTILIFFDLKTIIKLIKILTPQVNKKAIKYDEIFI